MASSIVMMEQDVSAEDIDPRNIRCPNCKSTTFVLYGNSQVSRTEAWENGAATFTETDPKSHAFEVESIECLHCMTRTQIKTTEVMTLKRQTYQLRQAVIDLGGPDPFGLGKPC